MMNVTSAQLQNWIDTQPDWYRRITELEMMFVLCEPEWYRMIMELVTACNREYSGEPLDDWNKPISWNRHPFNKTAFKPVEDEFGRMIADRIAKAAKEDFQYYWYKLGLHIVSGLSENPVLQEYIREKYEESNDS